MHPYSWHHGHKRPAHPAAGPDWGLLLRLAGHCSLRLKPELERCPAISRYGKGWLGPLSLGLTGIQTLKGKEGGGVIGCLTPWPQPDLHVLNGTISCLGCMYCYIHSSQMLVYICDARRYSRKHKLPCTVRALNAWYRWPSIGQTLGVTHSLLWSNLDLVTTVLHTYDVIIHMTYTCPFAQHRPVCCAGGYNSLGSHRKAHVVHYIPNLPPLQPSGWTHSLASQL